MDKRVPLRGGCRARSAGHEKGTQVRANGSSSFKRVDGPSGLDVAADFARGSGFGIAPRPQYEPTFARSAPITHSRGWLIYLKHRGVLNVEEFRRTNARGL